MLLCKKPHSEVRISEVNLNKCTRNETATWYTRTKCVSGLSQRKEICLQTKST